MSGGGAAHAGLTLATFTEDATIIEERRASVKCRARAQGKVL